MKAGAVALLLVFGLVRLPLESAFHHELRATKLRTGSLDIDMRDQIGQKLAVAVIGGFRSLVASILNLRAYAAFENVDWDTVVATYDVITKLQPRVARYWNEAHWHCAYNAASHYRYSEDDALSGVMRQRLYKEWVERGRRILQEGIRNNPGSYRLQEQMARLLMHRVEPPDPCLAAEYYARTWQLEGVRPMFRRFHAYTLAQCPGREAEAYQLLRGLYLEDERHHKPSLLSFLRKLEDQLGVPAEDRLTTPDTASE
jgi:hypothetical protein